MSLSIDRNYRNLSSGYKINSAAERGNNVLNVADGALSSMYDSLSRIRELGLQASNSAIYSKDELSMMQAEIDQIKQGITDIARNTQFNGLKLLDGSMATM